MPRHIALHKSYGVLSQFRPEAGHRSLAEFGLPKDAHPAGRLDRDSEGLMLLTDDGPFIAWLLDPRNGHPRTYLAQVDRPPPPTALDSLAAGPMLSDGPTRPWRWMTCGRAKGTRWIGKLSPNLRKRPQTAQKRGKTDCIRAGTGKYDRTTPDRCGHPKGLWGLACVRV